MARQALFSLKRLAADRKRDPTPSERRLLQLVGSGISTVIEAAHELDMTKGAVSKIKKKLQAKGFLVEGRKLVFAEGGKFPRKTRQAVHTDYAGKLP